jgi:hypothetical protein
VTIDGVTLQETKFEFLELSEDGTILRKSMGQQFISAEWRLFFSGIEDWDFGDGSAHSTAQNPSHVYSYAGNYTVKLTATGEYASDSETRTDYITIWNATTLPTAVGNITYNNTYNTYKACNACNTYKTNNKSR